MKKLFANPEINTVQLGAVEAVMSSFLVEPGANNSGQKTIAYSLKDVDRDESAKQSYWSGK